MKPATTMTELKTSQRKRMEPNIKNTNRMATDGPKLAIYQATSEEDLIASLHLIADSVAQQRQLAARAIISHPLSWTIIAILLAIICKILHKDGNLGDWTMIGTTWAGCIMAGLVGVRYVVSGYLDAAERTGTWAWLYGDDESGKTENLDMVIVTKFGDAVIGTVVLRATPLPSVLPDESRHGARNDTQRKILAKIRACTVDYRYRRHGLGTWLLEHAVMVCVERGWEGPVYDEGHANSLRLLPGMFNGEFEEGEKLFRGALERVVARKGMPSIK